MSAAAPALRCQLLPLKGEQLLLPSTAIAEIVRLSPLEPVEGAPPWLLGHLAWRDRPIPVVSFEAACDEDVPVDARQSKIVVLNALGGHAQLHFFGLVVQGMPQLLQVSEDNLAVIEHETELHQLMHCHVIVSGATAVIPDLDVLEERLLTLV